MTEQIKLLGVIIAGGESRRFNQISQDPSGRRDKFLAPFGGTTLLGHIMTRAKKQVCDLILNANGDLDRLSPYGLKIIADDVADAGPLGGILAAMKAARAGGYSHIVTFASDSPFFPADYVNRLARAVGEESVRIAIVQSKSKSGDKLHPVMGLFDLSLQDDLKAYIDSGERRVMWWVKRHPHAKVVWDSTDPDPFFNINRVEDLETAEQYLALSRPCPEVGSGDKDA